MTSQSTFAVWLSRFSASCLAALLGITIHNVYFKDKPPVCTVVIQVIHR